MNQHHKQQSADHQKSPKPRKPPHKDWRLWAIVILMLAAMGVYVLTMDESFRPGGGAPAPTVPADAP